MLAGNSLSELVQPLAPSVTGRQSSKVRDTTSALRVADRCKELGTATSHLSLVSSLSAGYAFSALVNDEWEADPPLVTVVRMLALAASLWCRWPGRRAAHGTR